MGEGKFRKQKKKCKQYRNEKLAMGASKGASRGFRNETEVMTCCEEDEVEEIQRKTTT